MQVITFCAYPWLSRSHLSTRHKHFILWYLLCADKMPRSCIWMWNQRSWIAKKNNFSVYSLRQRVAICSFAIRSLRVSLRAERWKCFFSYQSLKHLLKAVTLENLISHRSLLHEGKLVLTGVNSLRHYLRPELRYDTKISRCFSSVHY